MNLRTILSIFCLFFPGLSSAHEFWVDPNRWQIAQGEEIVADLRNGENFKGSSLAWLPNNIKRADLAFGETVLPFEGRMGDRPALVKTAERSGLAVLLHETTPSSLSYKTWEKFAKFVAHKDLGITRTDHVAQGHPTEGFKESYTRHVKSLVKVGDGAGADRAYGLATEFVALTNPYSDKFDGNMKVLLTYQSAVRSNAQIEVFEKNKAGVVEVSLTQTDANGQAVFPVRSGSTYLLDAVVIRNVKANNAIYETLWAGLTFLVP